MTKQSIVSIAFDLLSSYHTLQGKIIIIINVIKKKDSGWIASSLHFVSPLAMTEAYSQKTSHKKLPIYFGKFLDTFGADGETRTLTPLLAQASETCVSTIPPRRQ